MMHPAVIEAAVVGIPHVIDGEHPMAFVVVKKNEYGQPKVNEKELASFTDGTVTKTTSIHSRNVIQSL